MSSATPPSAPPLKKGRKPERSQNMAEETHSANEELKGRLMDAHMELQQERSKVRRREEEDRERRRRRGGREEEEEEEEKDEKDERDGASVRAGHC